ncbi:minor tail protein [Shewanella phage vB_SspS_KASIA]|nr:minor tail protein [Shewanella phage vB_SspS_KASIA]
MYAELDVSDAKGKKARTLHKLKEDNFGEVSPLLERDRKLDTKDIISLQDLFWDMHFLRKSSEGIEPFDPVKIETHMRLSCQEISPWEYKTLMEMDMIFRGTVMKKWG